MASSCEAEEDEDVVLAGSQLHHHLLHCGYGEGEGHMETMGPSTVADTQG